MNVLRFLKNRLRSVFASENRNQFFEMLNANLGSDLKALKNKLDVTEALPVRCGERRYLTKSGDIITIRNNGNNLEILNASFLNNSKPEKEIKDGTLIAIIKHYTNYYYPNLYKEGKGCVYLDRGVSRFSYKKGARKVLIGNIGQYPAKEHCRFTSYDMSIQKAKKKGITKMQEIDGGWQTPLNTAIIDR